MSSAGFVYVSYIATTPERLRQALTDGHLSRQYWGGRAVESDWRPGSPVLFRKIDGEPDMVRAKVLEVRPPGHLVLRWSYRSVPGAAAPPASRVSYTIEPAGAREVKLTVAHEAFEAGSEVDERLRNGWPAILSSLKSFLETGEALEVTKRWAREGI
ncbi:MAG: SRPBCC family protein [Alphaproteobacteria bacterium]